MKCTSRAVSSFPLCLVLGVFVGGCDADAGDHEASHTLRGATEDFCDDYDTATVLIEVPELREALRAGEDDRVVVSQTNCSDDRMRWTIFCDDEDEVTVHNEQGGWLRAGPAAMLGAPVTTVPGDPNHLPASLDVVWQVTEAPSEDGSTRWWIDSQHRNQFGTPSGRLYVEGDDVADPVLTGSGWDDQNTYAALRLRLVP